MFNRTSYVPHVEERQKVEVTLAVGTVTAFSNVPTIHAKRIDIIVESVTNDCKVTLRSYGAAGQAQEDFVLGIVVAGNTETFVHTVFIGQMCSLILENNNGKGTAADLVYTAWLGARA